MTPLLTINLLRVLFVTFCAVIGTNISSALVGNSGPGLVFGIVFGLVVVLIDRLLKGVSLRLFSSATFGLLLGLIFANLLMASDVLRYQSEAMQWAARLIVYALFGYLGMMLAIRSSRDEFSLIIPYVRFAREIEVTVHESTGEDADLGTDARLVGIAKVLKARLLTNDHALSQVARLQRVAVLNLADLARALRPSVVAGDEIDLHLIKEGREPHQAVGYLPDGTMIVVNHARAHVGKTRTVVVASALQTAAGRLIFAELKNGAARASISRESV